MKYKEKKEETESIGRKGTRNTCGYKKNGAENRRTLCSYIH